jgi:LacI family transcriptional regulator
VFARSGEEADEVTTPPRVALLVETSLSSGQDILLGVGQYIRERGPWAVYQQPHDLSQPPPAWFRHWEGDGIIARLQNGQVVRAVASKRVPVVDVLGVQQQLDIPLLHVDNRAIAEMAAEHLVDRGFTNFAYFGLGDEYWSLEREQGFREYVVERGYDSHTSLLSRRVLERTPWTKLVGRAAGWLRKLPLPVGIMLCSDVRGLLLREACQTAGLTIGEHVAIVGVGNDRTLCEMSTPSLSSVEANHIQVGYEAAALLDRMMRGAEPPKTPTLVKPWYVAIRESTDFLAVNDTQLAKALHFIRNRCGGRITLNAVASHAGLSRSVLQRRFRALLNRTVHEEITDARIHKAMDLLRRTDLPVDAVADKCGFGYAQNMGRIFRNRFGRSPRHYRRRPGGED